MAQSTAPPQQIKDFRPQTFRERGAVAAFTTPMLGGARVRLGARQQAEMVLCNPSGGRGVYILPLSAVEAFCHPTLFDRALIAEIRGAGVLTPAGLRKAARDTMAGGLAGRGAQRNAAEAIPRAQAHQRQTRAAVRLLLQTQLAVPDAAAALAVLSARLRLPGDIIEAASLALADLCAEIGIGLTGGAPIAPHRARLSDLTELVDAAIPWLDGRLARDMDGLQESLFQFSACAGLLDAEITRLLADMPTLIVDFVHNPMRIAEILARVDWLFDGWERIVALWRTGVLAGPLPSRATLAEILRQAPPLPGEAMALIGAQPPATAQNAVANSPAAQTEGQLGVMSLGDLLARNERMIAALA